METELLYQKDMLMREFPAKVVEVLEGGTKFVLDRTAFYPASGGIATDTGAVERTGELFKVLGAKKNGSIIVHEADRPGLLVGDELVGKIDWERRSILARYHTAAHLITGILTTKHGILVTGNQMDIGGGRIDVDWEGFSRENVQKTIDEANELIKGDLPVKIYELSREDVIGKPEFVKLAKGLIELPKYRIVEIVGLDAQPDGGCHVPSLGKIGSLIEFTGYESKGKRNKRFKFVIKD